MYEPIVTRYFGKELANRIAERDLPFDYVTQYCGISMPSLKECLNGERLATPWQLVLMAEILFCTVNDLLGFGYFNNGTDQMASNLPQGEYRVAEHMWNEVSQRMVEKDLTVEDIAYYAGVHFTTARNWFGYPHHSFPKTFSLICICDALDCTPSDLLGY